MIVLDGMPGAGKTTLLDRLYTALPDHVEIFPEAQPPSGSPSDAETAQFLLGTARERLNTAQHSAKIDSELLLASDRGHIGVLAYRYAMAATGRVPHSDFDHALSLCHNLDLVRRHRSMTTLVLVTDIRTSLSRRAAYAHDHRYRLWFDPGFLGAYRNFLTNLATWLPADAFTTADVSEDSGWPILLDLLPPHLSRRLRAPAPNPGRPPEAA